MAVALIDVVALIEPVDEMLFDSDADSESVSLPLWVALEDCTAVCEVDSLVDAVVDALSLVVAVPDLLVEPLCDWDIDAVSEDVALLC